MTSSPTATTTRFTREQRIAQSADRHQAVTAGAGAGKTSVLVERYIHLLFDANIRANVREIVAITFTRKAAAEMKRRVAEVIEARLADESYRHEWQRIKFVRERFSGAKISTIHSYCAQLLREFPIEAGVNPNFSELEEYDATLLKEQAINETLELWLGEDNVPFFTQHGSAQASAQGQAKNNNANENGGNRSSEISKALAARRVWTFFGKQELFSILTALLQSSEQLQELQRLYASKSNEELFRLSEQMFVRELYAIAQEYCAALSAALEQIIFDELSANTRMRFEEFSSAIAISAKQAREALSSDLDSSPSQAALPSMLDIGGGHRLWQDALEFAMMLHAATQGSKTCTQRGSISGAFTKGAKIFISKEEFFRHNAHAERVSARFQAMHKAMQCHEDDRAMLEIARVLIALASEAAALVEEEKKRRGGLDFDDLQLKADALLNNPDVCESIRRNTRFVMIDEFQDTNELQYRIAKKIVGVLGENPEPTQTLTNLFIVGDPKQSIYRFRGADVRVFAKAKRDIEHYNGILLKHNLLPEGFSTPFGEERAASQTEQQGIIGLRATFRLLPEIAAFVNAVAGALLRNGTSEFDVDYDEIICGVAASPLKGTITMLLPRQQKKQYNAERRESDSDIFDDSLEDSEEGGEPISMGADDSAGEHSADGSGARAEISEARLLAEYIRAIAGNEHSNASSEPPVLVRSKDGSLRKAEYGDIMILMRSRTGVEQLLAALRRAGVPFVLSAGRGFYERQEILDVRSFLLFLQNTNNDIALAAVLRSPFFALSDTELYHISRTEVSALSESPSNALWQRFEAYCIDGGSASKEPLQGDVFGHDNVDNDNIAQQNALLHGARQPSPDALRAYTTLRNLLPLAARLAIPTLIRTILEQSSWRAMLAGDERFEQIEANLEKLLDIARKYENKGFRNLYDFAEELHNLALYALSEGEANTDTGKNAVRIMTIHAAKGLEAPIVALYNTNADIKSKEHGAALAFDPAFGMAFTMFRARDNGTVLKYQTPLHYLASEKDTMAEQAELKRLLYVALTRAKDHLIISGKVVQGNNGAMDTPKGFLKMIMEILNPENRNLVNEPSLALPPNQTLAVLEGEVLKTQPIHYTIPILRVPEQFPQKQQVLLSDAGSMLPTKEAPSELVVSANADALSIEEPLFLLGTLETHVEGDYYSASQLQLFQENPLEYERLYRLGLPPADEQGYIMGRGGRDGDDNDATIGTSAGEAIHAVLEHLPLWLTQESMFVAEEFQRVVKRVLPETLAFVPPALMARIQRETQAIASTPLVRLQAQALNAAKFEHSVSLPFGADFLIGAFDVLLRNATDGSYEVWDWKTNRVGSPRDMDILLERYRLQLEVYAFIAARLHPEQERIRTRLLFTRRASSTAADADWTRILEFSRAHIQAIEERLRGIIARIRSQVYGVEADVVGNDIQGLFI